MKKAFITGINGQDGSYLAEYLIKKGYEVHGMVMPSCINDPAALSYLTDILGEVKLYPALLEDNDSVRAIIEHVMPHECYHFAGASFVSFSFDDESSIINTNLNATHFLISCLKQIVPDCRLYYAGSSEMFGQVDVSPQNEETKFNPRGIYGISRLASYHVVKFYRDFHNFYACTGITYNHESVRRGEVFVTRKITSSVAKISMGLLDKIELGNIDAVRDWGYTPDYVEAMWMMLNNPHGPNDYVICTGQGRTVREFLDFAFSLVGLDYQDYVSINKEFFRPTEKHPLIGDNSKIKADLNWYTKTTFETMVKEMVDNDIQILKTSLMLNT